MQRWKITIEYKGTNYAGWQIQPDIKTVQGQIELAISTMCSTNLNQVSVQGAGRTDSGVHAIAQVAHFDILDNFKIGQTFNEFKMAKALNHFLLKDDISILKAEKVHSDFHARFDAKSRSYIYKLSNRRAPLTFKKGLLWQPRGNKMDARLMNSAAQLLIGTHDFSTFRAFNATNQNPLRTIDYLHLCEVADEIHLHIKARSFLHNQVRYIIGALQLIGYGHWNGEKLKQVLDAKDRRCGGPLAPPHGLYLSEVKYE